ncbi:DUF58 domain-containing protein [Haladaptatus sp. GCM10025707]|uniref:DUF58 domain-containing protein n=1 Tax=unclassified Haladaptatus TaxID=2622732 RepID=UPI0023E863D2|nr:DUF58 domain-containing protein [Haladaptatus sp. QDMS2]
MQVTRRFVEVSALGGFLALLAVVADQPWFLLGAAGVGAWLLAKQYVFLRALVKTEETLTVDQRVSRSRTPTDQPVQVTLTATRTQRTPLSLTVEANPPLTATGSSAPERALDISTVERASTTFDVEWGVAGRFEFDAPTLTATDDHGLFRETLSRGPQLTVTVEPRTPTNLHVGQGGVETAAAYGEHKAGKSGTGLDPAELREYQASDAAHDIDWKATARLNSPFVRQYEAETDRTMALLLDHRGTMATGHEGERKLDYVREVAASFVANANQYNDHIGLYTVGDGGVTNADAPASMASHYRAIRSWLFDLEPTEADTGSATHSHDPATARQQASQLSDDDSAFGQTLHPYFANTTTYIQRIDSDPLFATARTHIRRLKGTVWTVILADDSNPVELRETVKLAQRGDDHVLVFLTPTVLFEPGGLADMEAAYERYVEFEDLRRELSNLSRVEAFEVAPGDRLAALLTTRRQARA